jgi:hypothetical protein
MIPRPSRHGLACASAWLLCAALYFWTAEGVSIRHHDRQNAWHHYEYLVDGFLSGHTYLARSPAPELLALPDPYDPKANDSLRLWDASLFRGRYYLYYGPAPAVVLMLPWKLITGSPLPQWAATAGFAIAGFGAIALLLAGVRRKYFPNASPARLFLAIVFAGHISWLPVILRRPAFWELPIVAAAALFWWSLFFLWKYLTARPRPPWAFAAGVALALAPAARPTYAVTAGLMALFFAFPAGRSAHGRARFRPLIPLFAPLALGAFALIAYNFIRFGHALEFGQHYQLWGEDYRGISLFSPANFPINLWVYFFTLPDLSPYFPFLRTAWIGAVQPGYLGTEEMPGLLFTMPALLLGGAACRLVWRGRGDPRAGALRQIVLAAAVAGAAGGVFLFCFGGACSRYITELLAGWTLVAGVGFLAFFSTPTAGSFGRAPRLLAGTLVAWTFIAVWLASFELHRFARFTQPRLYQLLAETLNYPSAWEAARTGQQFGPVALDIRLPASFAPGETTVLAAGRERMLDHLLVERLAPGRIRLRMAINDRTLIVTPVLAHAGPLLHVELHTPWLYPPAAHPYWQRFADPAQRRRLQTTTVLATSAVTLVAESESYFDAISFDPFVRGPSPTKPGGAWIEKLVRLDPAKSIAGSAAVDPPASRAAIPPAALISP